MLLGISPLFSPELLAVLYREERCHSNKREIEIS